MSLKDTSVCAWELLSTTIAGSASLTSAVNLGGLRLFGIIMPSSWTAANLTFQTSADAGLTWANVYDQGGAEVAAAADVSRCILLSPTQFAPLQYVRVRSGTAASPVSQAATRTLQLILRSV